jgi:hypothetical protein
MPKRQNLDGATVLRIRDLHAENPRRYSAYKLAQAHRLNLHSVIDILRGKTYLTDTLGHSVYQSFTRDPRYSPSHSPSRSATTSEKS